EGNILHHGKDRFFAKMSLCFYFECHFGVIKAKRFAGTGFANGRTCTIAHQTKTTQRDETHQL
ncbi:MAG: hypothetical protein AAFZ52_08180, partial [Bacteroidota bacterium]